MIAKISGQVVTADLFTPDNGKTHRVIQLLQVNDGNAELIKLKDKDVNSFYKVGSKGDFVVAIKSWEMNGKNGISCSVISSTLKENFDKSNIPFDSNLKKAA